MYVRTAASTKAKSFTDLGYFVVGTEGIPFAAAGTQILGELWVTYRVKLSRANLYNSLLGLSQPLDYYTNIATAGALWPTATAIGRSSNSGIWTVVTAPSTPTLSFTILGPTSLIAGCFQVTCYFAETTPTTTITGASLTSLNNTTIVQQRSAPTVGTLSDFIIAGKTATESHGMLSFYFEVNNTNASAPSVRVNISGTFGGTAGVITTVCVSQVPCTIRTSPLA